MALVITKINKVLCILVIKEVIFYISFIDYFYPNQYFILYVFRYYQGFFYDDQVSENCQIYLNDKCIICKTGYISNTHSCVLQYDNTLYSTF